MRRVAQAAAKEWVRGGSGRRRGTFAGLAPAGRRRLSKLFLHLRCTVCAHSKQSGSARQRKRQGPAACGAARAPASWPGSNPAPLCTSESMRSASDHCRRSRVSLTAAVGILHGECAAVRPTAAVGILHRERGCEAPSAGPTPRASSRRRCQTAAGCPPFSSRPRPSWRRPPRGRPRASCDLVGGADARARGSGVSRALSSRQAGALADLQRRAVGCRVARVEAPS